MDPSGIFPTSYRADRRLVRTRWQAACLVLFFLVMLAVPYLVSGRIIAVLNMMLISAVIAVIEAAGGRCSDFDGMNDPSSTNAIVSNGHLHDELLELIEAAN